MADKTLEPFKISDTRKPSVSSPKKSEVATTAAESPSLGFRRIEGILEREEPATVRASLDKLREGLTQWAAGASTNRDKAAAKKAIVAVDRTSELMDFLYKTKESLVQDALQKQSPVG